MKYFCGQCGKDCEVIEVSGLKHPHGDEILLESKCCGAQVYSDKELQELADASWWEAEMASGLYDRWHDEWKESHG